MLSLTAFSIVQGLKMINYEPSRQVEVTTDRYTSTLVLHNVQKSDSGNYSCVPSNSIPASIFVHILNGRLLLLFPSNFLLFSLFRRSLTHSPAPKKDDCQLRVTEPGVKVLRKTFPYFIRLSALGLLLKLALDF